MKIYISIFLLLLLTVNMVHAQWGNDWGITEIGAFGDNVSSNNNTQLNVTPYHADGTEGILITGVDYVAGKSGIDAVTEALEVITYEHHEIHSGSHYFIDGFVTLASGDTLFVKLVTPDSTQWAHFSWDISSSGIVETKLFEGASGGMTGGSGITPVNNNRNSTNTSLITITSGVTEPTSFGTVISQAKWGSNDHFSGGGGGDSRSREILMDQNNTYCRIFVSSTADNIIQFAATWYEHISKN